MPKVRLDVLLVERGLAESRNLAQRLVMAGQVRIGGEVVTRPSAWFSPDVTVEIDQGPRYVSRGGEKLEAALLAFGIEAGKCICADVGASTGGFTDCLLQQGAARVYAIDVGKGILHWRLRQDPRVVVMERTNARFLDRLPEPVDLVTIDSSFISLKLLLPVVQVWLKPVSIQSDTTARSVVALIKPQFEAGRAQVARGQGVIRDPTVHRQVLLDVLSFAQEIHYAVRGLIQSPLQGPKGNVEFLARLDYPGTGAQSLEPLVSRLFERSIEAGPS